MDYGLIHTAVWWAREDPDGYGGYYWDDPVEVSCRWIATTEMVKTQTGEEVQATAKVFLAADIAVGDRLFLGDIDDITSASGSPASKADSWEVIRFDKIPDITGGEHLRRAWV
jgi:hypothetical protein